MFLRTITGFAALLFVCGIALQAGCRQQPSARPRPPATGTSNRTAQSAKPADKTPPATGSANEPELPPGHPPLDETGDQPAGPINPHGAMRTGMDKGVPKVMPEVDISDVEMTGETVDLTGIRATVPEGWIEQNPQAGGGMLAAARKAQFVLPAGGDDVGDAELVVTHFPNMKGMDDANLRRWYGQFSQPDGSSTAAASQRADFEIGDGIQVTLVDIPGTMSTGGMMGGGVTTKEDYRMLAAIINHPTGPHFIKVTGPAEAVERWKPATVAFLKSAEASP